MSEELNNVTNINSTNEVDEVNETYEAHETIVAPMDEVKDSTLESTTQVNQAEKNTGIQDEPKSSVKEIPVITYVSEVPKSSVPAFNEDKPLDYEKKYDRLLSNEQSQPYRWSITGENKGSKSKSKRKNKDKKERGNLGLKVFAVAMSALFVFSFTSMTYMFIERRDFVLNNTQGLSALSNGMKSDESGLNTLLASTGINISNGTSSEILTTEEVISKVKPAVVCLEVTTEVTYSNFFGRSAQPYTQESIGTGFILTEDGYIATNYHVIEDAVKIQVTLTDGKTYDAEVIGGDEASDIAVVKIDGENLPTVELGDSESLVQGEDVVAIGTPAGAEFAGTATKGIISAINRNVDVSSSTGYSSRTMTVIQTDASINPGNSGGPLVNNRGQVIGINTMKLSSSLFEGMGFAIPMNVAKPVINDIIENPGIKTDSGISGESEIVDTSNVSFGLSGREVSSEEAEYYNIPQGWKISEVVESGACWNSGMQVSDIIVALDGETVKSHNDMVELKQKYNPGDKVVVTVYRNGDTYDFEITLAAANNQ